MKIKDENYINIQGWMRTQLGLKGNELLVYAIIYGFSQEEGNRFKGSLQYLADWCGATKQGISNNLKSLIEKGYIDKFEYEKNGVKFCEYSIKESLGVLNSVGWGIKQSLTNNIINNKEKRILSNKFDKIHDSAEPNVSFKLNSSKKVIKKNNLYSNCISLIDDFVTKNKCMKIRQLLIDHLDLMCESKKLYGLKQYEGILNKLYEIGNYENVVKNSIEHGYATFYAIDEYKPKTRKGAESISNPHSIEVYSEEDEKEAESIRKKLAKEGKKIEF